MAGRTVSLFLVARERVSKTFAKVAADSEKLTNRIEKLSSFGRKAGGIAALTGGVTALGAAAAPAAAAVAAMPAAMLAAKAATGVLKVGLIGVSDAMGAVAEGDAEALQKALKKLSPQARAFVQEAAKLKGKFDPIQKAVQDRLFDGLAAQMSKAAGNLLPTVRKGMVGVAGSLNLVAKEAAGVAQTKAFRGQLGEAFAGITAVVKELSAAVRPLIMSALRLSTAGLPLAKRMAEWAVNGAKAVNAFTSSKRGADFMRSAVQRAGDTLATLGRIVLNIGKILVGVFKNAGASGTGLLEALEQITAKAAAWVKSAAGQERIANVFATLREVMSSLVSLLPFVVGPLGALAAVLTSLPAPVATVVAKVLAFGLAAGFLAAKATAMIGVIKGVGGAFVTVWGAINKVMRGGPLGWILTAIGLLIAGLVLAYQKSETFRAIVQAAWKGIQQAVATAWNGFIRPALEALRNFLVNEVMPRVLFLWNNVFKPVFSDIGALVQTIWSSAVRPALSALWTFVQQYLGPAILWLYQSVVKPAFQFIGQAIAVAWNGIIKPLLQAWWAYISKVLVPVLMFLWKNVVVPVFKAIGAVISWAWRSIIQPLLKAWWHYVSKILAPVILWLWKNVVAPAFRTIGNVVKSVWNGFIRPAFEAIKSGVKRVGDSFRTAANFIKTAWKRVEGYAKSPIKFVVNTVLNNGILKAWNFVASKFGLKPDNLYIPLPKGFAAGGRITGPGGPTADKIPIMASDGEFMVNAKATRRYRPLLEAINRQGGQGFRVAKALGVTGDPGGMGLPGFAEGGIIGGLKAFFGKAKDFFMDGVRNAAKLVTGPILNALDAGMGGSPFGKMLTGIPRKIITGFLDWIDGKDAAIGGPGMKAVKAARSQIGVPYSWGGGGPHGPSYGFAQGAGIRGFDCSSLMQYAWYKATGKVMPRTTYTQKPWLRRVGTPRPGDIGQPHPGHTYMMSAPGRIVEAPFTGSRVREVAMRSTPFWGRVPWVMDTGGVLGPGLNPPIYNGTGGPEYVMRPDQLERLTKPEKIILEFRGDDLVQLIRKSVRVRGGNVQLAFGTRG